ncbi:GDP-L-fucose synthase family protein [Clostridium saccharoperbutylacetonicum]|uniref:GDP-L-fucose synthase family protein n=1 Tax=Clostridium saccharoperbutylacetonicum TaxID=36745 RepID=UPI0009839476|nr:GDP-L-fucose synthase [Clostridium saccharoperbutylacetonicum]AQR96995.1 GDP-L-fucose synthase [Clostridium saccharoperbutylacetonicum]NSB32874.1 GDP-L-fucose synthase [Clostridium saccharoperbutylacetonicum]
MNKSSKIFVAGHNGLVGSAIVRCLKDKGYNNLVLKSHNELDLINQKDVDSFFIKEKPEYVFLAAAKVGGIYANEIYPADFIYENLMIESNVIKAAHDNKIRKLLFLGSTCIYPKFANQPIKENELLSGELEETNEAYAIAKIAGLEMCRFFKRQYGDNFISCMPTNLYGPNDNFDLNTSHVMPALIRKIHEAKVNNKKEVEVWGTGKPLREFLHVDDMADGCVFLMNNYDGEQHVNIGTGEEISIKNLALLIKKIVGYDGDIVFDSKMKDGTPRKVCDVNKLNELGWKYNIKLHNGIDNVYRWYIESTKK